MKKDCSSCLDFSHCGHRQEHPQTARLEPKDINFFEIIRDRRSK